MGRPIWESRRVLDGLAGKSSLDRFVRDRAGESLAHVFTLLSLVLPREPLQIAFRSLRSEDHRLQGTAFEYLEGVLPPRIKAGLWPFLVAAAPAGRRTPDQDAVFAVLLRSDPSASLLAAAGKTS